MIDTDAIFKVTHRIQKQTEELKSIANRINRDLRQNLPDLERSIANELLRKVRATQNNKIDVLSTEYKPLTIKLKQCTKVGSCFMIALPIYNFISMMESGWISKMKHYTEDHTTDMRNTYQITLPQNSITKSLLFSATAPEEKEPYVTLVTVPQRVILILKEHDTKFPVKNLFVSVNNVPADVAVFE
jgi:hypothetical protein